ncbi:MAG: CHAT domain-containing protein [Sodalinema sp.]|uniref:CHAT domain-containing protein n=1 Tax=Sodalinema sp. TaxID=3080550 RepID=UPI00122A6882|nr:MAG: CHAT domain-containing protein [Phormidium sp. SL48-SHIP]
MTQEFQVSVTPVGVDEYLLRTERVEPGVPLAEEQTVWNLDRWMQQAQRLMNDPVSGLLTQQQTGASPMPSSLVGLGQELYDALFCGDMRDSWMMAQAIAQNHQQPLRLRLGLKGNRLPSLPWEVLHDGDYPLATGTNILFSRYQPATNGLAPPTIATPLEPHQPLRVLMAIAAPSDRANLELTREAEELEAELRRLYTQGTVPQVPTQVEILRQPDRARLTQALEHGHYHVFHYAGHSNSGVTGGNVYLVNQSTGLTETLSGDDLAGLLANNGIQLVLLNSCRGAHSPGGAQQAGERHLAAALVKRGIPAVLAMAERIPDEVALTLTRLFYRNLTRGAVSIDLSVSRARQGLISAYSSHQLYWSLPILYLHPKFDGYLTQRTGEEMPASEEPPLWLRPPEAWSDHETVPAALGDRLDDDTLGEMDSFEEGELATVRDRGTETLNDLDPGTAEDAAVVQDLFESLGQDHGQRSQESQSPLIESSETTPSGSNPLPKSPPQTPNPSATALSQETGGDETRKRPPYPLPVLAGVAAVLVLGLGGVIWGLRDRVPDTPGPQPTLVNEPQDGPQDGNNSPQRPSGEVTAEAIEQLSLGNIEEGVPLVTELLASRRNALNQADTALSAVPRADLDRPEVLFLKGRLTWQAIQAGDERYSLDDSRRFWQAAARRQPDTPLYSLSLGFVYYAEDNIQEAIGQFQQAIARLDGPNPRSDEDLGGMTASQLRTQAYAGLALAYQRQGEELTGERRQERQDQAQALQMLVLQEDAEAFQATNLGQHWLWTSEAIAAWQRLVQRR